MGKFSDKVFGANVDQKTKDIFNALQRGQYEFSPGESVTNLPEHSRYLGEKTTFARMWVAVATSGSDVVNDTFYYSINDNKFNSYEPNQSIDGESYFVEGTENPFLKPTAGITSISSRTEGALGAVRRTTVEFVVHNKNDFDNIYLPFFLKPGATVIVDFGWSDKSMELYDIESQLSNTDTELKDFKKFIYDGAESGPDGELIFTNKEGKRYYHSKKEKKDVVVTDDANTTPPGWIYKHKGLVDTNVGIVTSYNSKITQNGSYECSVELVSQNATILDNEISADNNLKFIFANKMEDILIKALTNKDLAEEIANKDSKADYSVLDVSDKQKFLNDFFTLEGDRKIGRIPFPSMKVGVYYETAGSNNQESLYISFALFNDLFLNNFVAKNKNGQDKYEVNFKINDYFVRYEKNLYRRQIATMSGGDQLPIFLYPVNYKESKDGTKNENENIGSIEQQQLGKNPYKTPVIPLRELFINVTTIKEAFNKKQTVNDALNYILDSINSDSYGVFDLKMIAPNHSYSEIGIQDNNLINPVANEGSLLTFDVTSGNSIVSNMDYSFETPKGGLQNMLAIGNKTDQSIFDVEKLDNLNFLNILKDKKTEGKPDAFVRSLPFNDVVEPDDNIDDDEVDVRIPQDYFDEEQQSLISAGIGQNWDSLVSQLTTQAKKIGNNDKEDLEPDEEVVTDDKKVKTLEASTDRDFWGKKAKLTNILKSSEETISPILPINLTLTIYGNTFLNIGDVFTINFLPKSYMPYVYFQILGVEHKIDSNWQTTYQTVFRVRPESKKEVVDSDNTEVAYSKKSMKNEVKKSKQSTSVANSIEKMEMVDAETPTKKLTQKSIDGKKAKEEYAKKGKMPNIIETLLSAKSVTTPYHVQMAYAWTQTILEYITTKQDKSGFKVLYNIRLADDVAIGTYDSSANIITEKELGNHDIFVDVDVMYEDDDDSSLKRIYQMQQSPDGAGRGISDDREVAEAMMQTESKKEIYKTLLSFLQNGKSVQGKGIETSFFGNKSDKVIDENFAPIISRIRFRTTSLDSDEKGVIFSAEPRPVSLAGWISDFIPAITLPSWFVINKESKSNQDFIDKLLENHKSIKIPEKT